MSGVMVEPGAEQKLQELARHQQIKRLYADILVDMMVCEIERWDKLEYLKQLQEMINGLVENEV